MIRYEKITEDDLEAIVSFYQRYLNSGDYMKEQLQREILRKDFRGYKAIDGETAVGFCYGKDGLELTYPHEELEAHVLEAAKNHKVHYVDAMVIDEGYRNRGISAELVRLYKEELIKDGYDATFGEIWIYPDGRMPSHRPMTGFGKAFWEYEEPYFYKDLGRYGLTCPICGANCICGAKLTLYNIE